MPTYGIIAEGPCDQRVIEQILTGCIGGDNLFVNDIQPLDEPGGWTMVLSYLRDSTRLKQTLQLNDYLVIHIDTDVAQEKGFDLPWIDGEAPDALIDRVILRLQTEIGATTWAEIQNRVIFAIAVQAIECWLLPIFFESQVVKAAKTSGCLETANHELRTRKQKGLGAGDNKFPTAYRDAAKPYRKRKELDKLAPLNPSLARFVRDLRHPAAVP